MAKKSVGKKTMDKKAESNPTNMVLKQTLYIAILVSITFGFMIGAFYTSFKLAKDTPGQSQAASMPPQQQKDNAKATAQAAAQMGSRILKLEELLKENPDNAEAWVQLGNLFFDSNRFSDSIEAYERSLELAPGNPNVLTDLGVMYRRNKSPEKAVEAFDRAIAAQSTHETARFNKGIVLMHDLNNLEGAIQAWEGLLEVNPMAEAPNGQLVNTLVQGLKQQKQ